MPASARGGKWHKRDAAPIIYRAASSSVIRIGVPTTAWRKVMMSESDFQLIQGCRRGDERAWGTVLDQYERLVFSIPLQYGLSYADAADIAQLTFTILMQSLDTLQEETRLASWLATVAKRHTWRLMSRRRRESTNPEADLSENPLLQAEEDPQNFSEQLARLEWVNQGMNLLQARCRELLLALYFDLSEPSYEEIAERLGMAVGSIGPTRARCLKRMKEALEGLV